ncbi:MAG: hypothetical protein MRZ79_13600 [Bacteroidia bacterium]|nr:hypothetical protein [Bacteroidia bacterium]
MKIYSMDLEKLMAKSFSQIFDRHDFKKIEYHSYKNEHCIFRMQVIDPYTIRMEFASTANPDQFYNLYVYLCIKLKESYYELDRSLYSPEYHKHEQEELAVEEFYQYLASFAALHLAEPFKGDFSWENAYHDIQYFLQNKKKIISEEEPYAELRPMLNKIERGSIKELNKAALKIYYQQKNKASKKDFTWVKRYF